MLNVFGFIAIIGNIMCTVVVGDDTKKVTKWVAKIFVNGVKSLSDLVIIIFTWVFSLLPTLLAIGLPSFLWQNDVT